MPERLEISHARNEKDHSLDAPYVENFSHTEYQSEATVYAYLKQVSDFLKRYQELDAEYALLPPEPYDLQNYLLPATRTPSRVSSTSSSTCLWAGICFPQRR